MIPDFVVVGHVTRDEHPDGSHTLGGAVTFAAIAARELGYHAAILTSAADNLPQRELLRGIEVVRIESATTTTFRNLYEGGHRRQYVSDVAGDLRPYHLPPGWERAKIALLGPLARELDSAMVRAFSDETVVGVSPQGWMRQWDASGHVQPRAWHEAEEVLPHADVLILSEEDLGQFHDHLERFVALVPLVVLTRGAHGCTVYRGKETPQVVPAFATELVDPTGAGDTFATAFLIRLSETNDPLAAALFGNAAASLAIESKGAASMPSRAQVEARLGKH